jgi:hypothetical protein
MLSAIPDGAIKVYHWEVAVPSKELRFKIEGTTPHTLPMSELADVLKKLAILYGYEKCVHFLKVEEGTATCIAEVENHAEAEIIQRTKSAARGQGPKEAVENYEAVYEFLEARDWRGEIVTDSGDLIVAFVPQREAQQPMIGPVWQEGTLDGMLTRIEGVDQTVHVTLLSERRWKAEMTPDLSRKIRGLFLEPIRLIGRGKWFRTAEGRWELEKFIADDFAIPDDASLPEIVARLRAIPDNDLTKLDDPLGEMRKLRHGE